MSLKDALLASKLGGSGGGGGDPYAGYDLVIMCDKSPDFPTVITVDDFSIVQGSIEACEQKIISGVPANAVLIFMWCQNSEHDYTDNCMWFENTFFNLNYTTISFASLIAKKQCYIEYDDMSHAIEYFTMYSFRLPDA